MLEQSDTIKQFVVENFLFGNTDGLMDDTSFIDDGIIDSTGILELVTFIENEFSIQVKDEELIPENLDSIEKVSRFINRKMQGS